MLSKQTVIPSSLNGRHLHRACKCKSDIVLLSGVNIGNLATFVKEIHYEKKLAFAHIDITGGFRPDDMGISLLKNMFHLDGVVSTNMHALSKAKAIGLETVYRLFLLDSRSLERAESVLRANICSAIEILPSGYALSEVQEIRKHVGDTDLIAGGFVRTQNDIDSIFASGFAGVTTSNQDLWR